MSDKKPVLVVIYNHKHPQNMPIINHIYRDRFSHIYHLMPFYQHPDDENGDKKEEQNIIPVYDNSFYFQGYVAQGFHHYYQEDAPHYIFIGDDLMLNPLINENNYADYFNLSENSGFMEDLIYLDRLFAPEAWSGVAAGYEFNRDIPGLEEIHELPSAAEANNRFQSQGLSAINFNEKEKDIIPGIKLSNPLLHAHSNKSLKHLAIKIAQIRNKIKPYKLSYPLVRTAPDIFIVPSSTIHKFCYYCGIFAAANLHVEIAIPVAMVLVSDEIILEKDIANKIGLNHNPSASEVGRILAQHGNRPKKLFHNWPSEYLYIHPVKLSYWQEAPPIKKQAERSDLNYKISKFITKALRKIHPRAPECWEAIKAFRRKIKSFLRAA